MMTSSFTNDNDDGNKDDTNETDKLSSNNDNDDPSQEESVSYSVSASSSTSPMEGDSSPLWIQMVVLANDNVDISVGDLNAEGVYDNNDADEGFVCMTLLGHHCRCY